MQTLGENEGENPELEDSDDEENTETTSAPRPAYGQSTDSTTPTETRITFEIDRNIDINSKALLDMISENDTVSMATAEAARGPATSKPTTGNPEKNITVAEAFENW